MTLVLWIALEIFKRFNVVMKGFSKEREVSGREGFRPRDVGDQNKFWSNSLLRFKQTSHPCQSRRYREISVHPGTLTDQYSPI